MLFKWYNIKGIVVNGWINGELCDWIDRNW